MQQHAVPQAITTYKFRLVGDMTLKQFLELGFGLLTAWMVFNSKTGFLIKWTLGPFLALLGFALAFVPIEDRPLDQWLVNFAKALLRPTQFVYQSRPKTLDIFSPTPLRPAGGEEILHTHAADLDEYIKTLPGSPATAFDQAEKRYLEHITSLFGALGLPATQKISGQVAPAVAVQSGVKGIRVRKLLTPQMCLLPHAVVYNAPAEPVQASMPQGNIQAPNPNIQTIPNPPAGGPIPKSENKPLPEPIKPSMPTPQAPRPEETVAPTFAQGQVLPVPIDKPNIISGITYDKNGKILGGVILEIRDNNNLPVRALKSNKLGQFFIVTPLADGIYRIRAEHETAQFAVIKLEAKDEVIPPLKVQAVA
jgi:hypothetical protein